MASGSQSLGTKAAKVFGIKLDYPNGRSNVSRGESVMSVDTADSYFEEEPTSEEWIRSITPSGRDILMYFYNLFPFTHWIGKYNMQWFIGDLIAGVTIGAVVVPQGMAYAKLAGLPVEFGLYSSFMGVLIYWFFATSKDITIGPVAVMSQVTGTVVAQVVAKDPTVPPFVAASDLAIIAGSIVCFLGLARLGWLVDLISLASISAFMTGAALNIGIGQIPTLMGISGFSTREATYKVIINTLQGLPRTTLDAAIGLTALLFLYLIKFSLNYLAKKQPSRAKLWFFCNTLRTVFVILLYTLIGWAVNRHVARTSKGYKKAKFSILGPVPRGFEYARVPFINKHIISLFADQLPAAVIVLIIEHISIAKSFGRINNYIIDPSQELVAIGVTNLLGPFLSAYPATGSFSRTAIKSKAGVRTPFAGVITAIVVLLAIYALPVVFFYIPSAALSAVIIHAVFDLIVPLNTVYRFWRINPLEVVIYLAGVIVTVFTTIEIGIYTTVATSMALFLFRAFKAQGRFLGPVRVHSVIGDHLLEGEDSKTDFNGDSGREGTSRNIFLPINHGDGSNPQVQASHPYPGIFIYRFSEGFNYPNANHYLDFMVHVIFKETRRTNPNLYKRLGDRPWNDPTPRSGKRPDDEADKPTLKAVILDFSSVNNVDITSVQHLIDVRNQLDRYAAPDKVQFHFASINNRWTKRALVSAGFGFPAVGDDEKFRRWQPVFDVAEIGGDSSAAAAAETRDNKELRKSIAADAEAGNIQREAAAHAAARDGLEPSVGQQVQNSKAYGRSKNVAVVQGINRPFFHIDLTSALQSAIRNSEVHTEVVRERDVDDKVPVVSER